GSQLVFSTLLGGSISASPAGVRGIAVDGSGNVYATGYCNFDYPTTPGAFQTNFGGGQDAFVTKLNNTGSQLIYSTFMGTSLSESGADIAVLNGNAYVTGGIGGTTADAFVAKFASSGSTRLFYNVIGGSGDESGVGIAVDDTGAAYVVGSTTSSGLAGGTLSRPQDA